MKIIQMFGQSPHDIDKNEHNIIVPICLGNKFFLQNNKRLSKNFFRYLSWALKNTKEKILVVVVDKIQETNHFCRNKKDGMPKSTKKVMELGAIVKEEVNRHIAKLNNVEVITWTEYTENDKDYQKTTIEFYKEFKNNKDFRKRIKLVSQDSVQDRSFSKQNKLRLCDYVLDEAALVIHGVFWNGIIFSVYIYPKTDAAMYFFEEIKSEGSFRDLMSRISKRRAAVYVLNN